MLRLLHSWPGLAAAMLLSFMAITGAVLSTAPALDRLHAPASLAQSNTAQLAQGVARHFETPLRLERSANGALIVHYQKGRTQAAAYVDAQSGAAIAPYRTSAFFDFFLRLHRSLLLGNGGRVVAGAAALALLFMALSGIFLMVKRLGGWRNFFTPARGRLSQRLHVEASRLAVILLTVTALSGGYLTLVQFGLASDGTSKGFAVYPTSAEGTPAAIGALSGLRDVPLQNLRRLEFPAKGDPTDVFSLTTAKGQGYVDQVTGQLLDFKPNNFAQSFYQTAYALHSGEGVWWYGLLLGLAALMVPVLGWSGAIVWWKRRTGMPKISGNAGAQHADTIVLVGSESNTSWGFAQSLHTALTDLGHKVHVAPMNGLARHYRHAERMFVLAATHGDGAAPSSADRFMARLAQYKTHPQFEFAVLGFGDKSFARYCGFAEEVEQTLLAKGWHRMQPMGRIDRQSAQSFAQWGYETGAHMGVALSLEHTPEKPRTRALQLIERFDYGLEVQAPTTVLRFAPGAERAGGWRQVLRRLGSGLPRFSPGDIVGIVPPQSVVPRYYSVASATRDGFMEICVRRQAGGMCSDFLHHMQPGDRIEAFIEPRADFRPKRGKAPVIMIGAGTGIAPFAGFIRHNRGHQPFHLYWGGRDAGSDFLYGEVMLDCLADHRLEALRTAFSRQADGAYVQHRLAEDAGVLRRLIRDGAQIMVCGGRDMANAVRAVIADVLVPLETSVEALQKEGRYVEDVY